MTPQQRVALVTGANRGLGYAISHALARNGYHVVLSGRSMDLVGAAASQLADLAMPVSGVQLDVTAPESIQQAVATVLARHGRIDVLVNNAGIVADNKQTAAQPDFTRVASTIDTNLIGAWRTTAAVLPHMRDARYGRIVNITSQLGSLTTMGATGGVAYRVSKAALNALTRVLADELAGSGVLVNACSPGPINTRIARAGASVREPEEATDTVVWLATLPDDGPTGGLWHDRQPMAW